MTTATTLKRVVPWFFLAYCNNYARTIANAMFLWYNEMKSFEILKYRR